MFRSSKPAFLNVTVRNLPPGTTQDDVVRHINGIVLGAQPKVGPVVLDADKRMLHTSVTLQLDSDAACRNACAALHGSRFYPLNPEQPNQSADLAVKEDFLGVTTVAEHDDAQFDIYFVHGLGGHAFRTWSTTNRVPPVMWPRDLLPEDVKAAGLSGRFSTIGYQAQAFDTWSATTTIQHAARNLLVQIATDRPEGSERPIYFVCHSLGGLVICQAILNELYLESNQTVRHEQYRRISTKDGQCLVKGIFFFGTPFEGSQLANHASKFVKFLGGNEALIDSLKFRADGLRTIVSQFNQLRNNVNTKIPILIAYEKAPLYGIKFVTRPESAMSVFEDVTSVGIDGDHKTMIKFPDRHDAGYRTISQLLIRMIASTLSIAASSPPLSPASPAKLPETGFNPTLSRRSHTMSTISSTRTMPPAYSSLLSQRPDSESSRPFSVQGALSSPTGRPQSYYPGQSISPPGTSNGGTTRLPFHHPPKAVHRANLVPVPEDGGGGTEDTTRLARLSQFDTVFVIDDSGSMNEQDGTDRSRWEVLIDSMKYIVDIVCHYDPNGVDVRFLFNDAKDESEIREGQRVLDLLSNEVEPDDGGGGTFMAQVLWMVLQNQLDRFEEFRAEMKRAASSSRGRREARPRAPRKLNLICITDGEATDKEEVESTIVDAARRLDELKAPSNQIGIQFVQIGNNNKAAAWLKLLDDKLKQMYNVRDIVDTRPFNSPETLDLSFQQRLQRILLGAILREVDDEEDEEDQG